MDSKFTQGPWQRGGQETKDGGNPYYVYCDDVLGSAIAKCDLRPSVFDNEEIKANANLIVAATDLVEALEGMLIVYAASTDKEIIARQAAQAAINKALNP